MKRIATAAIAAVALGVGVGAALAGGNGSTIETFPVSFVIASLIFAAIYKVLPNARLLWRDVLVASFGTALLFEAGQTVIGYYLANFITANIYGHLATALGPCWPAHDLCLYALDIASGLWSVLYLQPSRDHALLSAQAEYQARILPALAAQLAAETTRCGHTRPRSTP